jgi:hypothetical protein
MCKRRCGGVWRSLHLAGVWSQAVGFVLVRLTGIWWFQSPEVFFTFNLFYHEIFFKFCTFNAIRKDNAAVNFITVHHKEVYCCQI